MSEYGNVIHQEFGAESAQARVIGNELDPEKAQRAVELGDATGIEPHVIAQNLDEFDRYHKASLGAQIVRTNQALKQYIDSHPMAAAVSGDDLGQLDKITDKIKDLNEEDNPFRNSPLANMGKIFAEGYGEGPAIGAWVMNNPNNFNEDGTLKYPFATAIATVLGAPLEIPMRAFGGALALGEAGIEKGYATVTGDPSGGKRLARELPQLFESYMGTHMGRTLNARQFNQGIRQEIQKVALDQRAQMYWQSGKELPIGLSKDFDAAIERVSKEYWKKIDDLASEADKSATKERNPEFFRTFIEQHPELEGAYVRVDAEAIQRLYGEGLPLANDGLLGFIPNLDTTLKVGTDFGIPVRVPLIDWVTKVDKDLREVLKDDARAKLQSVSKKEAEDLKIWHEKYTVEEGSITKGEYKEPPKAANDQDITGRGKVPTYEGAVAEQTIEKYAPSAMINDFNGWREVAKKEGNLALGTPNAVAAARAHSRTGQPAIMIAADGRRTLFVNGEKAASDPSVFKHPPVPHDEAIRSVRQSSGLEPTSEIFDNIKEERKYGAEKLKLARLDKDARQDLDINIGSNEAFDITDDKGNIVGTLQGTLQNGGKEFFIGWISSRAWAQSFGPKQVRALIVELKREYPELETISGNRVTGAREGTEKEGDLVSFKAQINPEAPGGWDVIEGEPPEGKWETFARTSEGDTLQGLVKPKKLWTENELKIHAIVNKVINKIGPKDQKRGVVHGLRSSTGHTKSGVFINFAQTESLVLVSLASKDPIATAAHEAGHALKKSGVFSEAEWDILTERALKGDGDKGTWFDQYQIKQRYGDTTKATQIEEAIMHKFGDYVSGKWMPEAGPIRELFERLKEIVTQIRLGLKEAFGRELTAEDIFEKARVGGYKGRRPLTQKAEYIFKPNDAEVKAQRETQLELPGVTRTEDQQVFEKASAAGLPVKQYKKLMQAIEDVRASDRQYQLEKAEAYERKKQTKEWKKEAEELEPKIQDELNALPDYRANEFFRTGVLDGEKLKSMPKLNPELIDPEIVRGLPERYLSEKGMHPDDAAGLLGIDTGSSLVQMLADWKEAQGDVAPAKFVHDLIKGEVERRMSAKHGPLSENIIDAARDHVINNAQYELIHQDLLAAALRAGKTELPISKKEMEAYAKDQFMRAPVGNVSVEELLREVGKAQRLATLSLLDGDPVAALKHMEHRMMAFIATREAKKLEVQQRIFDRNAKHYSDREVKGIEQNYLNFIHDIYMKLGGVKLNFTREDWAKRISEGSHRNLEDFVVDKMNDLLEIKADDRLLDDTLRDDPSKPPLDNLTVQEFLNANDFIKSMIKNGREEARGDKAFENSLFEIGKKAMLNQLSTLDPLEFVDANGNRKMLKIIPGGAAHVIRTAIAAHWQMEALFNRMDRGDAFGVFTQKVMRPLIEGSNSVSTLERKYSKKLEEIEYKGKMNEKISNSIFKEPSALAEPDRTAWMAMTRENLLKVLMYWGSETGREKLSRGYNIHPDNIQRWIDSNATKADYEYAEAMGKVFRDLKEEIDVMYTNVAGVSPENVKLSQIVTPFGQRFDGWYTPLVPHPNAEMTKFGGAGFSGLVQRGFFRSTTANGHTMRRTSAVYPLDLSIDSNISVMKRQIYDLAMRPGLIEASRFLKDPQVRSMITSRLGREITDLINPYIKDVANAMDHNDGGLAQLKQALTIVRSNVIGTLIGWNPGTVMKHGPTALVQSVAEVGAKRFSEASVKLWMMNEEIGKMNWDFAMETSEELQRRHQHYFETLRGQSASMLGEGTKREFMARTGAWPVAMSDLASAVPLWTARFEQAVKEEGHSFGDARYLADRAVRRAHGSTAVTNRPRVMRSEAMAFFNPLYGFFNHILNRKYEMGWQTKDKIQDFARGKITPTEFLKFAPHLAMMLTAYVMAPTLIEEMVSPLPSKPDESWGKKAGKAILYTQGSDWLIARDVAHFAVGGYNPGVGLFAPMGEAVRDTMKDLSDLDKATSEENLGRTLKHTITTTGMATGLTNAQMGRWAQLAYNYSTEKDVPDGWWQWLTALRYGTTKGHAKTPEEYVEHLTGGH